MPPADVLARISEIPLDAGVDRERVLGRLTRRGLEATIEHIKGHELFPKFCEQVCDEVGDVGEDKIWFFAEEEPEMD